MRFMTFIKLIICLGFLILAGAMVSVVVECIKKRSRAPYYKDYGSTFSLALSIIMLVITPFEYYYTSSRSTLEVWDSILHITAILLAAHGVIGYFISIKHTNDD